MHYTHLIEVIQLCVNVCVILDPAYLHQCFQEMTSVFGVS